MSPLFSGSKLGFLSNSNSQNSSPIITTDPYFSNVVLLLKMEGPNGGTTFTDSSSYNRAITRGTGATISTAASAFGSSSAYLNGTNQANLSWSSITLSGNFTVEMFVRFDDYTLTGSSISNTPTGRNYDSLIFNEGGVQRRWATAFNNTGIFGSTVLPVIQNNIFYHIALTKSGNTVRSFFDGNQLQTVDTTQFPIYNRLGGYFYNSIKGYVDEVRITDGIARYTSNFQVPTSSFPTS